MDHLDFLPAELLTAILGHLIDNKQHLYSCAFINKTFYRATMPLLWERLDINDSTTLQSIIAASASPPRFPGQYVKHITLGAGPSFVTDDHLLALTKSVPFLGHLIIRRFQAHISDTSLQHVPRFCPFLTHFTIECQYGTPDDDDDDDDTIMVGPSQQSIDALVQWCHPQLTHITLESCRQLDARVFSALGQCRFLERLTIDSCELNDMKDATVAHTAVAHLNGLTRLKALKIWYHSFDHTVFVQDGWWPQLIFLSLYTCPSLDDTRAIAFIRSHRHLQHLEFRDTAITDATLQALVGLPDLVELVLDWSLGLTPAGLRQCLVSAASLQRVDMYASGLFLHDFPDTQRACIVTMRDDGEDVYDDENQVIKLYKDAFF